MQAFLFHLGAWIVAGAAPLLFSGCVEATSPAKGSGRESVVCKPMKESLALIVKAKESREAILPEMGTDSRYAIDLPSVAGLREGFVAFVAGKTGSYHFALSSRLMLEVTHPAGVMVQPKGAVDTASGCAEVQAIHAYALEKGRYVLHLSSASEISVDLVAVEAVTKTF